MGRCDGGSMTSVWRAWFWALNVLPIIIHIYVYIPCTYTYILYYIVLFYFFFFLSVRKKVIGPSSCIMIACRPYTLQRWPIPPIYVLRPCLLYSRDFHLHVRSFYFYSIIIFTFYTRLTSWLLLSASVDGPRRTVFPFEITA